VGLLDETFGLGFFEDDDYCIRTRMVGYKLICIEDVFIYHKGSASFSALPDITHDLLRKNKMLLEAKFGIRYSIAHPRDRQLDIIESYIERIETSRLTTALLYKINNRLQLVEGIKPRGPLKRLRFERRLHSLQDRLRPYLSL
jgi:GT2 family glycosyltransferase